MTSQLEWEDISESLKAYVQNIESSLASEFEGEDRLSIAAREALRTGGKRIRPLLCLLACESVSGSYKNALPISVAYELAHNASLVQDDIIDNAELRRNSPTVHTKYGVPTAMLTSDIFIFRIFEKLAGYKATSIHKGVIYELLNLMGQASRATALGEQIDMDLGLEEVSVDDYLNIVKLKSAKLVAAPTASGALIGGGNKLQVSDLYRYGESVGSAYQIRDDVLDIVGNPDVMGKPILMDVRNRSKNLVLIHTLRTAPSSKLERFRQVLLKKRLTEDDVGFIFRTTEQTGSVDFAMEHASQIAAKARGQLVSIKRSHAREKLEYLTYFAVNRVR